LHDFALSDKQIEGILGDLNFEKSSCPHCGSGNFVKYGRTSIGRQRYRCRVCRKTFSETTDTPFMYSKKTLKTWVEYIFCMEGRLTNSGGKPTPSGMGWIASLGNCLF